MRNTEWAYGMVIYAGHDTKLVQNSGMFLPLSPTQAIAFCFTGKSVFKRTHIDELMNKLVLFVSI